MSISVKPTTTSKSIVNLGDALLAPGSFSEFRPMKTQPILGVKLARRRLFGARGQLSHLGKSDTGTAGPGFHFHVSGIPETWKFAGI
jgi:hypothetical protein